MTLKDLYKLYLYGGNLNTALTDQNAIDIDYPDGSKYVGALKESDNYELLLDKGVYRKKQKNNNSYYKSFEGTYDVGVPHGPDCTLEIKLSTWPKYHAFIN